MAGYYGQKDIRGNKIIEVLLGDIKEGEFQTITGPEDGEQHLYLGGLLVDPQTCQEIQEMPLEDLPPYIGTAYEPLVKKRLENAT